MWFYPTDYFAGHCRKMNATKIYHILGVTGKNEKFPITADFTLHHPSMSQCTSFLCRNYDSSVADAASSRTRPRFRTINLLPRAMQVERDRSLSDFRASSLEKRRRKQFCRISRAIVAAAAVPTRLKLFPWHWSRLRQWNSLFVLVVTVDSEDNWSRTNLHPYTCIYFSFILASYSSSLRNIKSTTFAVLSVYYHRQVNLSPSYLICDRV